jgi:hypothetical protein
MPTKEEVAEVQAFIEAQFQERGRTIPTIPVKDIGNVVMVEPTQQNPVRAIFTQKDEKGRDAMLIAIPVELPGPMIGQTETLAKKLRFELTRYNCDTLCKVVAFKEPVLIRDSGIFRKEWSDGISRFKTPKWLQFDPWQVFSGNKKVIKGLESSGVRFIRNKS